MKLWDKFLLKNACDQKLLLFTLDTLCETIPNPLVHYSSRANNQNGAKTALSLPFGRVRQTCKKCYDLNGFS